MTQNIVIRARLPLPASRAWEMLTQPQHLKSWIGGHVSLDAELGGRYREITVTGGAVVETRGIVTELTRPSAIGWTWKPEEGGPETYVRFDLFGDDIGTTVELRHSGWGSVPAHERDAREAAWRMHMDNLVRYVQQTALPVGSRLELGSA